MRVECAVFINLSVGPIKYKNINIENIFTNFIPFNKKILTINIDINATQIGKIVTLYL